MMSESTELTPPNKECLLLANEVFLPARWNARQGLYHPKAVTFTLYLLSILFQDCDPLFLLQLQQQQVERPFIRTNTGTEGTQLWEGNNRVRRKRRVLVQAIDFLCLLLKGKNRTVYEPTQDFSFSHGHCQVHTCFRPHIEVEKLDASCFGADRLSEWVGSNIQKQSQHS